MMMELEEKIRQTPLADRIDIATGMITEMCKERRPPKMSIPVQPTDEDVFITVTLRDVKGMVESSRKAISYLHHEGKISEGWAAHALGVNRLEFRGIYQKWLEGGDW